MKISSEDSAKLELSGNNRLTEVYPEVFEAIFKVNKADYVPASVRLRSRINATMFIGELRGVSLDRIRKDTNVVSVSMSKSLRIIE